jgi:cation transport regulator
LADLPDSVKENLPNHAQEIYRAAFNSAWDEYVDTGQRRGGDSREETAHKVAWAAVKEKYEKRNDRWVAIKEWIPILRVCKNDFGDRNLKQINKYSDKLGKLLDKNRERCLWIPPFGAASQPGVLALVMLNGLIADYWLRTWMSSNGRDAA